MPRSQWHRWGCSLNPRYQGSQLTGCSVGATHRIDGRTEVGAEGPGQIISAPRREHQAWDQEQHSQKSARKSKAREAGKELAWEGVSRWQGLHLRRPSPFSTGQKEDPVTRDLGIRHCRTPTATVIRPKLQTMQRYPQSQW